MICLTTHSGKSMANKKEGKRGGTIKTAYTKRRYNCPNCGIVYGTFCVKCRAIKSKGKTPSLESLIQPDEPGPKDPSPLEIAIRARGIFKSNMMSGKVFNGVDLRGGRKRKRKKRRRQWENSVRIVRIYKDP